MPRRNRQYFDRPEGVPAPLVHRIKRRIPFREVDLMGYVWFGHYASLLEDASTALLRQCALSYEDFIAAALMSPMVEAHVDYRNPLVLDEMATISASVVWSEGARLNIEYRIVKEDGRIAATGYTVQVFVDAGSQEPCFVPPRLIETFRTRWKNGELRDLQQ